MTWDQNAAASFPFVLGASRSSLQSSLLSANHVPLEPKMHFVETVSPILGELSRTVTSARGPAPSFLLGGTHCSVWLRPQPRACTSWVSPGPGPLEGWQQRPRFAPTQLSPRPSSLPGGAGREEGAEARKAHAGTQLGAGVAPPPALPGPRGAKWRSLDGCVRSPQEGGKEAGGAFTTRRGPDRSDKEEGSRRRCGSELTTPPNCRGLQLASRRLPKRRRREGRLRPLPGICRKRR